MYIVDNIYYKVGDNEERQLGFFLSTNAKNILIGLKDSYNEKYRASHNITKITKKVRIDESYQKELNNIICEEIKKDPELKNTFLEYINLDIDPCTPKYNDLDVLFQECSFDFSEMDSTKVNEDVEPIDGLQSLIELFGNDNEKFFGSFAI